MSKPLCGEPHPDIPGVTCALLAPCGAPLHMAPQPWDPVTMEVPPPVSWPNARPMAPLPKARPGRDSTGKTQIINAANAIGKERTTGGPVSVLEGDRDGHTYEREFDLDRLNAQAKRVYAAVANGAWYTLREISDKCGDPEASVSARLRDLRKEKFGGHNIERRARERESGVFEYRLAP